LGIAFSAVTEACDKTQLELYYGTGKLRDQLKEFLVLRKEQGQDHVR